MLNIRVLTCSNALTSQIKTLSRTFQSNCRECWLIAYSLFLSRDAIQFLQLQQTTTAHNNNSQQTTSNNKPTTNKQQTNTNNQNETKTRRSKGSAQYKGFNMLICACISNKNVFQNFSIKVFFENVGTCAKFSIPLRVVRKNFATTTI